jgi:hypothetical protein
MPYFNHRGDRTRRRDDPARPGQTQPKKRHLQKAGSAVAELFEIPEPTPDAVRAAMVKLGLPLVIKNRTPPRVSDRRGSRGPEGSPTVCREAGEL